MNNKFIQSLGCIVIFFLCPSLLISQELGITHCIKERTGNDTLFLSSINTLMQLEKEFIKNDLLEQENKESYSLLLKKIQNRTINYNYIDSIIEKNMPSIYYYIFNNSDFCACLQGDNKNGEQSIDIQLRNLLCLSVSQNVDQYIKNINNYLLSVSVVDFKNQLYRLPLLAHLIFHASLFREIVDNNVEKAICRCIEYLGSDFILGYTAADFNLVELSLQFEQILIDEGIISNEEKHTYINLAKRLSEDRVYANKLASIVEEKLPNAWLIIVPTNFAASIVCFNYYMSLPHNVNYSSTLYLEYKLLKSLWESETLNEAEVVEKVVNIIDDQSFKRSVYRLPVLSFICVLIMNK